MIKIVNGDIFDKDNFGSYTVICHQVNCQGVMGSGVAEQVKKYFPECYNSYRKICEETENKATLLGKTHFYYHKDSKIIIANMFAQNEYGYTTKVYTDYNALKDCFNDVADMFETYKIAIPYLISCCRGGGDWVTVEQIIIDIFEHLDVTLYRYKGK